MRELDFSSFRLGALAGGGGGFASFTVVVAAVRVVQPLSVALCERLALSSFGVGGELSECSAQLVGADGERRDQIAKVVV